MSQQQLHQVKRAFTLVELLIVIGVLIVLAAIGFSLAGPAITGARKTNDISNMRQIGVAFALYSSDRGAPTYVADDLVKTGYLDPQLLFSVRDPYPGGHWNYFETGWRQMDHLPRLVFPYPNSYFSLGSWWLEPIQEAIDRGGPDMGWLACAVAMERRSYDDWQLPAKGPVLRLKLDGSVIHRNVDRISYGGEQFGSAYQWFGDYGPKWLYGRIFSTP